MRRYEIYIGILIVLCISMVWATGYALAKASDAQDRSTELAVDLRQAAVSVAVLKSTVKSQNQVDRDAATLAYAGCLRGNQTKKALLQISDFQEKVALGASQVPLTPDLDKFFKTALAQIELRRTNPAFQQLDCKSLYPLARLS